MTLRTDLSKADALSHELDAVTAALALVATGTFSQSLQIGPTTGPGGFTFQTNIASATLTTMLTARQTALQSALTALGVS